MRRPFSSRRGSWVPKNICTGPLPQGVLRERENTAHSPLYSLFPHFQPPIPTNFPRAPHWVLEKGIKKAPRIREAYMREFLLIEVALIPALFKTRAQT
jgi:hypothetical protein